MESKGTFYTMLINPEGDTQINDYFFILELPKASGVAVTLEQYTPLQLDEEGNAVPGTGLLSFVADYGSKTPGTETAAYMGSFLQQYVDGQPDNGVTTVVGCDFTVTEKVNGKKKDKPTITGTVQKQKTVSLYDKETKFADIDPDTLRYKIANYRIEKPDSTPDEPSYNHYYFILTLSKTDKQQYNKQLDLQTTQTASTITCTYTPQTVSGVEGNVAAIGFLSSGKDEYTAMNLVVNGTVMDTVQLAYSSSTFIDCWESSEASSTSL